MKHSEYKLPTTYQKDPMNANDFVNLIKPCGNKPNCLSSMDERATHNYPTLSFNTSKTAAMGVIRRVVESLPRTQIKKITEYYLHAECKSRLFGFTDDLEILILQNKIFFRSSSRVGYGDLGVNKKRLEFVSTKISSELL